MIGSIVKLAKEDKLLIFDFPGHPFQFELSSFLSKNSNYQVYHLYNSKQLGPKSNFISSDELKIVDVPKTFSKNNYKRLIDEIIYSFIAVNKILKLKPSIIISSNMPLIPQLFIFLSCRANGIKFIFWLQDIISIAANKILKKQKSTLGLLAAEIFKKIEFYVLRNSDNIVTISEDFDKILIDNGVKLERINYIPNWAPLKDIPVLDKKNSFSLKHNLENTFNILYSGTLGFKHNPDILLQTSRFLIKNNMHAKIVVISEGPAVDYLKDKVKSENLNNFYFLPFQDFGLFPKVLATADISLVLLEKDAGMFSVPSKFLSILCSQRIPIVYVPKDNLTSKIATNYKCGINVENQDELDKSILSIYQNQSKFDFYASNGRNYANEYFDISKISQKFLNIINS